MLILSAAEQKPAGCRGGCRLVAPLIPGLINVLVWHPTAASHGQDKALPSCRGLGEKLHSTTRIEQIYPSICSYLPEGGHCQIRKPGEVSDYLGPLSVSCPVVAGRGSRSSVNVLKWNSED